MNSASYLVRRLAVSGQSGESSMSIVSDRHSVVPFKSGETKPLQGQRLAKIGYKDRGDKKAKFASVAVSVPFLTAEVVESNIKRLLPHIGTMLETAQDGVIRSLYESAQGGLSSVSDADISIDAIIGYLEAESNGSRLTKDMVVSWFNAEVRDNLFVVIAEKLGFSEVNKEQEQVIDKHVGVYRDILSSLTGGRTILEPKQIAACERAIALASSEESDIGRKLVARLETLKNPKPLEELLEL